MATKNKLRDRLSSLGAALQELREKISHLNRQIDAKQNERAHVEYAVIPREELLERFESMIDARAERGAKGAEGRLSDLQGLQSSNRLAPNSHLLSYRGRHGGEHVDEDAIAFWFGDLLRSRAQQFILEDMPYPAETGLPTRERPAAIERLDAEIDRLETEKKALLDDARGAGVIVEEVDIFRTAFDPDVTGQSVAGQVTVIEKKKPQGVKASETEASETPVRQLTEVEQVDADIDRR